MYFDYQNTSKLKIKGQKKIYHVNTNEKKAGVASLNINKVHVQSKDYYWDKGYHFTMMKGVNPP